MDRNDLLSNVYNGNKTTINYCINMENTVKQFLFGDIDFQNSLTLLLTFDLVP